MTPAPTPWRHPRILLLLFLVFLAGVSAGMLVMALGVHRWIHETQASASAFRDTGGKAAMLDRFKRELNLTPEQTQQLELVLDDFFTYYHTLQAQLDDVRARGKQDILRILDNRQKQKFERLMAEWQQNKQLR